MDFSVYLFFKALHVVGFVSWFAGIFYLVRLFIYHTEARADEPARYNVLHPQFSLMEKRLYSIIMHPAMIITWICGITMLVLRPAWLQQGWLHTKLLLLVGLTAYHFWCRKIMHRLWEERFGFTSFQLRLLNELPTLLLVAIVLLAIYKNLQGAAYGIAGLVALGVALFVGARQYKKRRQRRSETLK